MSNFDPNAILRGAQLTIVGTLRALQNPDFFTSELYRQAALAVATGVAIKIIIAIPIVALKALFWLLSSIIKDASWDDSIINSLDFINQSVLQIPFFLMALMRYLTPALDDLFMNSLRWVDETYLQKHKSEGSEHLRALYWPNLQQYSVREEKRSTSNAIYAFVMRFGRRAMISLTVYFLSFVPFLGRFVLPAASFYTFRKAVGTQPALVIFGSSIFMPRKILVIFLQTYFASRSLMRELLEPYFSRIKYPKDQKRLWIRDREGVLFGFGVGFYILSKIPLLGVLVYGLAEASTAYLITKITDPPPLPSEMEQYTASQIEWKNKHEFLKLPLADLDAYNVQSKLEGKFDRIRSLSSEIGGRKFS